MTGIRATEIRATKIIISSNHRELHGAIHLCLKARPLFSAALSSKRPRRRTLTISDRKLRVTRDHQEPRSAAGTASTNHFLHGKRKAFRSILCNAQNVDMSPGDSFSAPGTAVQASSVHGRGLEALHTKRAFKPRNTHTHTHTRTRTHKHKHKHTHTHMHTNIQ